MPLYLLPVEQLGTVPVALRRSRVVDQQNARAVLLQGGVDARGADARVALARGYSRRLPLKVDRSAYVHRAVRTDDATVA